MGILNWFTFKSPEERARDSRLYDRWAFPYGEAQKAKVRERLRQLLPEEAPSTAMAVYLIGREGYLGHYKETPEELARRTEEEKLRGGAAALKKQLLGRNRRLLPRYLALIVADEQVDEELCYPPEDALRQAAQELAGRLERLKQ